MHPRIRISTVQVKHKQISASQMNSHSQTSFHLLSQRSSKFRTFTTEKSEPQSQPVHSFKFDPALLDHIVCPVTKTKLRYDEANQELISDELSIAFPIKNGTPHLLPQSGRVIDAEKLKKRMAQQSS